MSYKLIANDLPYFQTENWLWPDEDESLAGDVSTLLDLDEFVMPHLVEDRRRVVLQAGGAVGVWPKRFAQLFAHVYSFEPYPPSFHCMTVNAPELNVYKFNAALGHEHKLVYMDFPEHRARSRTGKENIGGFRVMDAIEGVGHVIMLKIDDLALPILDLLYLDLEGYELFALHGGLNTIMRCKPHIVVEDKAGCCQRFGYKVGDVERFLQKEAGYRTIHRFHGGRDLMLEPPRSIR